MRKILGIALTAGILGITSLYGADTNARAIMERVEARDDGKSMESNMKMVLIDKNGDKREREIKLISKDKGEDEHKIMFFLTPADVKDSAFLTYDYNEGEKDDDQWLYLPALKKVKRIPSSDKSSSFMGSDFTYSDMTDRDLDDYDFKLLKEMEDRGHKAWVIESTPKNKKVLDETGYVKSLLIIRQDNLVLTRAVHTMQSSGYYKYYDVKELKEIDGIWQPTEMVMTTKNGKTTEHSTILLHSDVAFNKEYDDSLFTTRTLEKGL